MQDFQYNKTDIFKGHRDNYYKDFAPAQYDEYNSKFMTKYSKAVNDKFDELNRKLDEMNDLRVTIYKNISESGIKNKDLDDIKGKEEKIKELFTAIKDVNSAHYYCAIQKKGLIDPLTIVKEMVNNLYIGYNQRLADIIAKFTNEQTILSNKIKSSNRIDNDENDDNDDNIDLSLSRAPGLQQQSIDDQNSNEFDQYQKRELEKIEQQLKEILEMFQQLSDVIRTQGQIIDRISYKIDEAFDQIKLGNKKLAKAEQYQKESMYGFYAYLFAITLLIIILGGIVVGKKIKRENANQVDNK